jgi:exoribonuclease-2
MFSRAGIRDMNQAHNLLVRLDIWHEDENLDLHRFNIKIDFSRPALEETDRIVNTRVDFSGREDLTGLSVFTIDGPFTRDFDDALSLEAFNGGYRLGIHITDVAPFIEPDGPLDREAFGRASSIYLPADKIPMFPPELSNNALSLVKDVKRLAITLLADFDEHWNLIGHRFAPTVVQIEKQLTYDEVNETYLEDPIYLALYRLAQALRQKRAEGGAMLIPLPEIQFEFNDDGPVRVALIEQDTPAKLMVSECMILYNWLTAKFAAEYNIPILFRGQGPPQEILPIDESRYIYYVFQQRRKLHPLSVDTVSQPHSGIGVDVYTNATSPLRRYMDLLVQRQIHSSLATQRPVYTESRLKEICMSVQQTLKDIDLMRRNQIRYWVLKHLAGRIHERLPAIVFQKLRSKYLVILTDLLFVAELPSTSTHELSPGEEITVIVRRSAPRDDIVILELAP